METYEYLGKPYVRGEPIPLGTPIKRGGLVVVNALGWRVAEYANDGLSPERDDFYAIPVPPSPQGYEIVDFREPHGETALLTSGEVFLKTSQENCDFDDELGWSRFILRKIEAQIPQAPKALKLEVVVGKSYRTRHGFRAVVIEDRKTNTNIRFRYSIHFSDTNICQQTCCADGRVFLCEEAETDLIAEWEEPERAGGEVSTKPDSPKCTPPASGPSFLDPEPQLSPVDWFRKYGFQRQASLEGFPPAFELGQTAEYRPVQTCACCHGKLQATRTLFDKDGQMVRCLMPCPECGGTGWHTERSAK